MLFMIFTTSVVNAHALSHLFDGNNSTIEHCKTCDEYVLTHQNDVDFIAPTLQEFTFHSFETKVLISVSNYSARRSLFRKSGKYYNKPPPFKLV